MDELSLWGLVQLVVRSETDDVVLGGQARSGPLGELENSAFDTIAGAVDYCPDDTGNVVVVESRAILSGKRAATKGTHVALRLRHLRTDSGNLPLCDADVHRQIPRTT